MTYNQVLVYNISIINKKNKGVGNKMLRLIQADNRNIFGYGSGYGILPYFEGGVGVSSYYKIFNTIGLEFKQVNDTLYIVTKK